MRAATGESRVNSGNGVRIFSPKASAKRPAIVVAAFTVICCPRIARIAIFETVKRTGHTQTGIFRHAFFQKLVFHQMRRDQIRRAVRSNKLRSLPSKPEGLAQACA